MNIRIHKTNQKNIIFNNLVEKYTNKNVKEGTKIKAEILAITKTHVIIDLNYKTEGYVNLDEFISISGKLEATPGNIIEVIVESEKNDIGEITFSKKKADSMRIWDIVTHIHEKQKTIRGVVVEEVKGGLIVNIGLNAKAFLPGSQLGLKTSENPSETIGKIYNFKIIKFNKKRLNVVLSRRALLEEEKEEGKEELIEKIRKHATLEGTIKNITPYGAFVDLGGIDGLLHIADITWGKANPPSKIFILGQKVTVKVLKFDFDTKKISLGMKQLQENPWLKIKTTFPIGSKAPGRIASLSDFGCFVELIPGIEGLVHLQEMSWTQKIKHPSAVVAVGDKITVTILDIDQDARRISLGMKQTWTNPWDMLAEKFPKGKIVTGVITGIVNFGLFVTVNNSIDGLVHVSDISWTKRIKHLSELYEKGQTIKVMVLGLSREDERLSLGIKQIIENPWNKALQTHPIGSKHKCKVLRVTDYGAFMELKGGLEGLCHISEMADTHIENLHSFVKENQIIEVVIIDTVPKERKIGLTMKLDNIGKLQEKHKQQKFKTTSHYKRQK